MALITVLFVLVILLERFVPVPLTLTLVLVAAWSLPATLVFGTAFVSGVLADLIRLRTFGVTSALFLSLALVIYLVRQEVEASSSIWVFISSVVAQALWFLWHQQPFSWWLCLGQGMLVWLVWKTFSWLSKGEGVYLRQGQT